VRPVSAAAIVTGLAAHFPLEKIISEMGEGFLQTRALQLILLLPLAVIGLLERHGLRLHAQNWIAGFQRATVGRLLIMYLFVRETTAAVGLADELNEVLKPFYRVESSRNRDTGGTGLGLAIAQQLAIALGGSLSLSNREGGGLCAELILPAH